jgi:hypothetical protein
MTGTYLLGTVKDGVSSTIRMLLSKTTLASQSFLNYQDVQGLTTLHFATVAGHVVVIEQIITVCCDLEIFRRRMGSRHSTW